MYNIYYYYTDQLSQTDHHKFCGVSLQLDLRSNNSRNLDLDCIDLHALSSILDDSSRYDLFQNGT